MIYLKGPSENKHVKTETEARQLESLGWVRWPRTQEQKAGIVEKQPEPVKRGPGRPRKQ